MKRVKNHVTRMTRKHVKNPVEFLTSQIRADYDAVKLVREAREDL